jgi:hypothetical protein
MGSLAAIQNLENFIASNLKKQCEIAKDKLLHFGQV